VSFAKTAEPIENRDAVWDFDWGRSWAQIGVSKPNLPIAGESIFADCG